MSYDVDQLASPTCGGNTASDRPRGSFGTEICSARFTRAQRISEALVGRLAGHADDFADALPGCPLLSGSGDVQHRGLLEHELHAIDQIECLEVRPMGQLLQPVGETRQRPVRQTIVLPSPKPHSRAGFPSVDLGFPQLAALKRMLFLEGSLVTSLTNSQGIKGLRASPTPSAAACRLTLVIHASRLPDIELGSTSPLGAALQPHAAQRWGEPPVQRHPGDVPTSGDSPATGPHALACRSAHPRRQTWPMDHRRQPPLHKTGHRG